MIELKAPLNGRVLPIEAVPDPVFAQKLVGPGLAIDPTSSELKSPISGTIVQLHKAHHALTIAHASGLQVLIHVGIDTVKLNGHGFFPKVKLNDSVIEGQTLLTFDADSLAQKAKSLITVIAITDGTSGQLIPTNELIVKAGDAKFLQVETKVNVTTDNQTEQQVESKAVRVELPTGLHARPTSLMVGMAKAFRSEVSLVKNGQMANAKSLVSILGLEVANGDEVRFVARGPDAEQAAHQLAVFLEQLREEATQLPTNPKKETHVFSNSPSAYSHSANPNVMTGIAVSPGLAVGRIYQVRAAEFEFSETTDKAWEEERAHFEQALVSASEELTQLRHQVKNSLDSSRAAIFSAHQELLEDPDILSTVEEKLKQKKTAAFAWNSTINEHAQRLANLNNELLANRANDLRDVGQRVLGHLVGKTKTAKFELAEATILIAENLTPSETVQLDRNKIVGFCTTTGGATSHVAILARSLGLPAIAGIDSRALELKAGSEVVLDGEMGELRLNPNEQEKARVAQLQKKAEQERQEALTIAHKPALTKDGHHIEVCANIGSPADARTAVEMGADGVGLLRSEFLFLERETAPSEEEQLHVYQEIADTLGARPLTIRTLDVGGDKPLKYLPLPAEENPFLGVRGIRIGLKHPEILRQQLRAILRVRSQGKINVMFPMIATLEEFRQAKTILEEERAKLGVSPVNVGIMVEVPSVALIADSLAREADFFSIGTNDLTQYTLAMDRGHTDLAKQVDALHPSVLKLIELSVQAAHRHGKWVGVCGGIASDLKAVQILVGLGVDELSVSLPSIPLVKSAVRSSELNESKAIAQKALPQTFEQGGLECH